MVLHHKMINEQDIYTIIVAAGSGSRFGSDLPKQFCTMNGGPVLMTTIDHFAKALPHSEIIVVLSDNMVDFWQRLCHEYGFRTPHTIVIGGATRFDSVSNALNHLQNCGKEIRSNDIVLVHDGARPNVSKSLIHRAVESVANDVAAIPVVGVTDSIRMKSDDGSTSAVDRSRFVAVQTPQAFRAETIFDAYTKADRSASFTDDASVAEAAEYAVGTFDGDYRNIKITNPADIVIAELFSKMIADEENATKMQQQ